MGKITITEALAELKTIDKRISKKQEFILPYLFRQEGIKDPLAKDGGSESVITKERQAIADLRKRKIDLKSAIVQANRDNIITICNTSRSIANWLVWRTDVAPSHKQFLAVIQSNMATVRQEAQKKGWGVKTEGEVATNPQDIVLNFDEKQLGADLEEIEEILGTLDGQLSLKNATVTLNISTQDAE